MAYLTLSPTTGSSSVLGRQAAAFLYKQPASSLARSTLESTLWPTLSRCMQHQLQTRSVLISSFIHGTFKLAHLHRAHVTGGPKTIYYLLTRNIYHVRILYLWFGLCSNPRRVQRSEHHRWNFSHASASCRLARRYERYSNHELALRLRGKRDGLILYLARWAEGE